MNARPHLVVIFAFLLAITLIADNFFLNVLTELIQLALWGSLILILLIATIQIIRTEKEFKDISDQLIATKERLGNEIKHRLWAEKTASETKIKSQIIDENIPVMLAFFNTDTRCRYHNRIFRRWFGLGSDQIEGRLLKEFANEEFVFPIQSSIGEILAGKTIHNERVLKSAKGFPYIFTEQYIPHLDNKGKTTGFYTLHTPRAQEKNRAPIKTKSSDSNQSMLKNKTDEPSIKVATSAQQQDESSEKSGVTAARISDAIENGEFKLYCQKIVPIKALDSATEHYEILIRMNEEESNLMPPGSFLPLVNQFNMMPKLDRWIINYIMQWLSAYPNKAVAFYLNIAKDTLRDHSLPEFISNQLQKNKIPAASLCFEIELSDVETDAENAQAFIQKVRALGCLVSLCSFSGTPEAMRLLDKISVDYVKIDGTIVCNILRDDDDLAQITAIHQATQKANIRTIAELVETDEITAKLQEIGIDFGQGFGIAKPHPFEGIDAG